MKKIISLLTDFGLCDHYVGVMKGVMLTVDPDLRFIDISHSLPPFTILSASYLLFSAWEYFPAGTVFLSVVDPGVGSTRKTLIYVIDNKFLITPDNGTISLLHRMYDNGRALFVSEKLIDTFRVSNSSTFHGRDIFAPLAARVAKYGLDKIQAEEREPVIFDTVWPDINREKKRVTGTIIHIDRFGNCISTIHHSDLSVIQFNESCKVKTANTVIRGISQCFSDVPRGKPLVYRGSSGFLEVAVREGNAASILDITQHMKITVDSI